MGTWDLAGREEAIQGRMLLYRLTVASLLLVLMSSLPACACHRLSRSPLPGPDDCPHNGTEHAMTSEHEGNGSVRKKRSPSSTEESARRRRNSFSTEDSIKSKRSLDITEDPDRYMRSPLSTEDTNRNKRSPSSTEESVRRRRGSFSPRIHSEAKGVLALRKSQT